MAKKVIGLVGPIGIGKSTLGEFISSENGRSILEKYFPDHNLRYIKEQSDDAARELFYENREIYSDDFELIQARLRVLRHKVLKKHKGLGIIDTTLISGSETYRRKSHIDGYLTHKANEEYDYIIKEASDQLGRGEERQYLWCESLLVYLKGNPEILQERQTKRNDLQEKIIPLNYLEDINKWNDYFIDNINSSYNPDGSLKKERKDGYTKFGLIPPRVLILEGTLNKDKDHECLDNHTIKIGEEIKKLWG